MKGRQQTWRKFLVVCCGLLLLPLVGHAASQSDISTQQILQRMEQLQNEVQQLKSIVNQRQLKQRGERSNPAVESNEPAPEQVTPKAASSSDSGITFGIHGFVAVSAFWQDRSYLFGNGVSAVVPAVGPGKSANISGFDVRNTRVMLDVKGLALGNWGLTGRVGIDFAGGHNGSTAFSGQQPTPRLRTAYVRLTNADFGATVTIGQQWDLMTAYAGPMTSLTHIYFAPSSTVGTINWRYPGVTYAQTLGELTPGAQWKLELGVFSGNWNGPGSTTNFETAGNSGFRPQVEARLGARASDWNAGLAVHYSREHFRDVSGLPAAFKGDNIDSWGVQLSGGWTPGLWSLKGAVYTGNALAVTSSAMGQFGDIDETGGWVQLGYEFIENWTVYVAESGVWLGKGDVSTWIGAKGRIKQRNSVVDIIYDNGTFGYGIEWMHSVLHSLPPGSGSGEVRTPGNQLSVSTIYRF